MYRFSYKVNQRRRIRQIKRQSARYLIASDNNSSDDNCSDDNNEQLLQVHGERQELHEEISPMVINNEYVSFSSCVNDNDDDIDRINEDEYEDDIDIDQINEDEYDERPLYHGSSITVTNAVHRISNFYLKINLDKQKVNSLLRLIKHILPKPNLLPSTLKSMNKSLHHVSSTSTSLLCSDCYHSCKRHGARSKTCINPNCLTSFRRRRTTEIIEIVRFDVRSQIQSIMNRNAAFINKPRFFPPSIWSQQYNKVLYPYKNNDLTPRTHDNYLKAAREAIRKSSGGKEVAVDGIKGLSSLFRIFKYPTQIIYDFMHLVCLGHIPYLMNRWCSRIDKKSVLEIDNKLQHLCIPHNMKVVFLESIKMASQWKAKNSRLFVLHVGVPIMLNHLPILLFSHFVVYSLAIKILYSSQAKEDVLFAERLLDFYCRTASNVHDPSIEIFSLHAHLHLSHQVRQHGGLTHMTAFAFESSIRYIKKKAHGSINLASQIGYWINIRQAVQSNNFNVPKDCLMS
ncbi:unnamed protein product, partial [Rotaria magnacalcarata]